MNREGYKDPTAETAIRNIDLSKRETRYLPKDLNRYIRDVRAKLFDMGYELKTLRATSIDTGMRYLYGEKGD